MEKNRLTKDDVYNFLLLKSPKKYTVNELFKELKVFYSFKKFNYFTVSKWIEVLIALKKINFEDYTKVKIVWCNNDKT